MNKTQFNQITFKIKILLTTLIFMGCQTASKNENLTTQTTQTSNLNNESVEQKKTPEIKKLKWDMHPDQDGTLAGYRIYLKRKAGAKDKLLVDLKDPKATELPLSSLGQINEEKANYLYLTVYDQKNIESKPSVMICIGKKCPQKKNETEHK